MTVAMKRLAFGKQTVQSCGRDSTLVLLRQHHQVIQAHKLICHPLLLLVACQVCAYTVFFSF
jgi:hypothetical protein